MATSFNIVTVKLKDPRRLEMFSEHIVETHKDKLIDVNFDSGNSDRENYRPPMVVFCFSDPTVVGEVVMSAVKIPGSQIDTKRVETKNNE